VSILGIEAARAELSVERDLCPTTGGRLRFDCDDKCIVPCDVAECCCILCGPHDRHQINSSVWWAGAVKNESFPEFCAVVLLQKTTGRNETTVVPIDRSTWFYVLFEFVERKAFYLLHFHFSQIHSFLITRQRRLSTRKIRVDGSAALKGSSGSGNACGPFFSRPTGRHTLDTLLDTRLHFIEISVPL
jgi:hypothetical protein